MTDSPDFIHSMNCAAAFFDAEYAGYAEDLPALEAYAMRTGGPLLELGCGTGRALVPLAQAGYAVTGVDLRPRDTGAGTGTHGRGGRRGPRATD